MSSFYKKFLVATGLLATTGILLLRDVHSRKDSQKNLEEITRISQNEDNNIRGLESKLKQKSKIEKFEYESNRQRISETSHKETSRVLFGLVNSRNNEIEYISNSLETEEKKIIETIRILLHQKKINLAIKSLEKNRYVTKNIDEMRYLFDSSENGKSLIECNAKLENGENTKIGILVDTKEDPEYNYLLFSLKYFIEKERFNQIDFFNRQPIESRIKIYQEINQAEKELNEYKKNKNAEREKIIKLNSKLYSLRSKLPKDTEIDEKDYFMKIER